MEHINLEISIIRLYSITTLTSADIITTGSKNPYIKNYFIHKESKFQVF